jgi:hypothetical protein
MTALISQAGASYRQITAAWLLALISLSACARPHSEAGSAPESPGLPAGVGIALRVSLPRDRVPLREERPLVLRYDVITGAEPVRFDNAPEHWSFHVLAANGTELGWERLTHPATGASDGTEVVLSARGTLGQASDLRCVRDEAGYGGDPLANQECLGSIQLPREGEYRVIVEYRGPDLRQHRQFTVAEDSATGVHPPTAPGTLRMADTATLVVTGGSG